MFFYWGDFMDTNYLLQQQQNAKTGLNTQIRPSDIYEGNRKAQLAALESTYQQNLANLTAQSSQIPGQYDPLRAQAAIGAENQRRMLQEKAANAGLSGLGGDFLTWQQRNTNNASNMIGSYNLAQQQALNNIGLERSNLGIQYGSDVTSANANIDTQIAQAQYNEYQTQLDRLQQWWLSGKMTNKQFKAKWKELTGEVYSFRTPVRRKTTPKPTLTFEDWLNGKPPANATAQ